MLAVTGATGQLGHATIQALLRKAARPEIVAVVRDPQKASNLAESGVQVRPGDYNDPTSLVAAFQGVDTLLLVSTSELEHDLRVQQHRQVIDAAQQAGVQHVLYTSVLNPSAGSSFGASPSHLITEDYLRASGMAYTIFRNTLYLELIPMLIGAEAVSSGHIYFAAGEGKVSFASRNDIAQALANVLTTKGHEKQVYAIASAAHTFHELAATLSEVTGQSVQYAPTSGEDMAAAMRQQQVPEPFIALLAGMAKAMNNNEFNAPNSHFEQLLGHQPISLKTYLQSVYGK